MTQLTFTVEDCRTPERLERLFRQLNSVLSQPPPPPPSPNLEMLAAALAPLIRPQLQAGGIAPLNLQSLLPDLGVGAFLQDTHANRLALYNPNNYPLGTVFVETDRTTAYITRTVSGAIAWVYFSGIYQNTLANIPTDLGTNDSGFGFYATDYSHLLSWGGAAWGPNWGLGDDGSDYYRMFESAPAGYGASAWQICDGTAVDRLNPDATVTNVTTPNVGTAAYLKGGTSSAAVAAAGGTTANTTATNQATTATNQAAATGITVDAHPVIQITDVIGTDDWAFDAEADAAHTVNDPTHNHTQDSHNHTQDAHSHGPGSLELRNKQARLYYRR